MNEEYNQEITNEQCLTPKSLSSIYDKLILRHPYRVVSTFDWFTGVAHRSSRIAEEPRETDVIFIIISGSLIIFIIIIIIIDFSTHHYYFMF